MKLKASYITGLFFIVIVTAIIYSFYDRLTEPHSYEQCVSRKDSDILYSYPPLCITRTGKKFVGKLNENSVQVEVPETIPTVQEMMPVSWEDIQNYIKNCMVKLATQTPEHEVYLTLADGKRVSSTEPAYNDIFKIVQEASPTCGIINVASE
jgi:hypothetical protein